MPYPINLGDIISYTIEGRSYGQQVMSVLHYVADGAITSPDGQAVLTAALAILAAPDGLLDNWKKCVGNNLTNIQTRIQKIAPVRYRYVTYVPAATVGTAATPSVAGNLSAAITKRAELATKHGLGTLHMPAVPSGFITTGELNGLAVGTYADLQSSVEQEVAGIPGGLILVPVIFNRAAPLTSPQITQTQLQFSLRTMHRRTVGVGS